ncbi:hypothetical protein VNO77_23465 [Canavalia gladiata]|uniref:Uncharacterized protein n=1 Tax=Canavalia gladiata TaxID=3824 RepID=A0AAN9L4G6_CANGL
MRRGHQEGDGLMGWDRVHSFFYHRGMHLGSVLHGVCSEVHPLVSLATLSAPVSSERVQGWSRRSSNSWLILHCNSTVSPFSFRNAAVDVSFREFVIDPGLASRNHESVLLPLATAEDFGFLDSPLQSLSENFSNPYLFVMSLLIDYTSRSGFSPYLTDAIH